MILTIGHSAHPAAVFTELLSNAAVELLVDIRRYPVSRRHPQFRRDEMERWLPPRGIGYRFAGEQLGGQRPAASPQLHPALDHGLSGYAQHMATYAFRLALREVVALAAERTVALMCAEEDPGRCHRWLLSDALVLLDDTPVEHVRRDGTRSDHRPSPTARREGDRLLYDVAVDRPLPFS